ncbi:zinc transporter, partial [Actinomyces viscosus]
MWEEQPHEDCVSNGGHIPDIDCMRNLMRYPSQPQEPADGGGGPRTITVTTRQAATLIA